MNKTIEPTSDNREYLPIMLKIYENGKFTSALYRKNFNGISLTISSPKGRGLELETTKAGTVIIVAGGTGLFPFSDIIDLIYK
jgi:NAD(P)H-flavin reductase